MKIGVKTYDDFELASYFRDKADFLEVMAIVGKDYSWLRDYPLPIVIHCMHEGFGINFADETLSEKNREAIDFAIELADRFDSEKIILHSGKLNDENCSFDNSVRAIKDLDKRIIIENCPNSVCAFPNDMFPFMSETGKGFCFDINHAICSAEMFDKNYMKVIEDFLKLGPSHFHLSGQSMDDTLEDHLSFEDSDVNFEEILRMLPRDSEITLEVTQDIEKTEGDLNYIRSLVG